MKVLSLFDGMSCGQIALSRAGVKYDRYFASEIDKHAKTITQKNYPDTEQLGDVKMLYGGYMPKIDLLIGGSPCQGFSFAGKQLDFDDPRSKLFFEYVRILKEIRVKNPDVKFMLENVRMKKEFQDIISYHLGVEPIMINSSLLSAQNRKRLYWTNIPNISQPEDKGILLKDVVFKDALFCGRVVGRARENGKRIDHKQSVAGITTQEFEPCANLDKTNTVSTVQKDNMLVTKEAICMHNLYGGFKEKEHRTFLEKSPTLRTAAGGGHIPHLLLSEKALSYMNREGRNHWEFKHHSDVKEDKSATMVANFFKGVPYNVLKDWRCIRKFDPIECERLQTVPDNYTEGVSNTQRYKMLGNGWTIDVIAHILKGLLNENI